MKMTPAPGGHGACTVIMSVSLVQRGKLPTGGNYPEVKRRIAHAFFKLEQGPEQKDTEGSKVKWDHLK